MKDFKRTEIWHIIDGEFVHCVQEEHKNEITYWTNGLYQGSAKFKKNGFINAKSVKFV